MDTRTRISLLSLALVICTGLLFAPISNAGERPVNTSYAGIGYATSSDPNGDGFPVDLSLTDSQGTLGAARLAITTEWLISPHECRVGYDVPFALANMAVVYTFADQSQLFGFSQSGWLCANPSTGAYYGEAYGVYGGGTGRFKDASGEWSTKFDGATLDPGIDFRSIRGTAIGRLLTR